MYIAIDDTYGPNQASASRYITGARRTHVAVVFRDNEVAYIRDQIRTCLRHLGSKLPSLPTEFHFTDIYNRRGVWKHLDERRNLFLLEPFAKFYRTCRWKVFLQTVDNHTLRDWPKLSELPRLDGLDPKNRADLSLLLLCLQIRSAYKELRPPIHLIIDQGRRTPNSPFGRELFADWGATFSGRYESSSTEPLLQIADFLAFSINRSTYLLTKGKRTNVDYNFITMVRTMDINCSQLKVWSTKRGFAASDVDAAHIKDRIPKGLE
jgi:hypothetical protein